jgi:hypothetical protein
VDMGPSTDCFELLSLQTGLGQLPV